MGKETVRRWVVPVHIDGGQRQGGTSEELAKIEDLKAKVLRLKGGQRDPAPCRDLLRGGTRPPQSLIVAFIDELRVEGYAVESIWRVLREQGCQVAWRTYRDWTPSDPPVAARSISDTTLINQVRDLASRIDHEGGRRRHPRTVWPAEDDRARATHQPAASPGSVDRAMRSPGLRGIQRSTGIHTTLPAEDGKRAGDLLDRGFTAEAPNRTWVMDFTYVRTWDAFVNTAFILDVFAPEDHRLERGTVQGG